MYRRLTATIAFPVTNQNDTPVALAAAVYADGDETDSATTLSSASTVRWSAADHIGGYIPKTNKDCSEFDSPSTAVIANAVVSTSNQAKTLWGDLRFPTKE